MRAKRKAPAPRLAILSYIPSHDREIKEIEQTIGQGWTIADLRSHIDEENFDAVVAEQAGLVVGYLTYTFHRDHVAVERVAVHADFRRRKVATRLVDRLQGKLVEQFKVTRLRAWVPDDNEFLPAHLFLRSCGFKAAMVEDEYIRFLWRPE